MISEISCPVGFQSSPDGTCLVAVAERTTWQKARSACNELGRLTPGGWAGRLYQHRGNMSFDSVGDLLIGALIFSG